MEVIYIILALVFCIFSLILFFKLWGMCNDMRELKKFLLARFYPVEGLGDDKTVPRQEGEHGRRDAQNHGFPPFQLHNPFPGAENTRKMLGFPRPKGSEAPFGCGDEHKALRDTQQVGTGPVAAEGKRRIRDRYLHPLRPAQGGRGQQADYRLRTGTMKKCAFYPPFRIKTSEYCTIYRFLCTALP